MTRFHIELPKGVHRFEDILCKTLASKSALQVDLKDPSCYQISIHNMSSCPKRGIKVIGQSAVKSEKTSIQCNAGNIFIPLMMRIETLRFGHQSLLTLRKDEDIRKWISKNLFRAMLTGCKLELWDKTGREISHLNHKAAIDFSRIYAWNLYPYTDEDIWRGASWFQLIEISSHITIPLYNRPAIKKQQRQANKMIEKLYDAQRHNTRKRIIDSSTYISRLILENS